MATRTFDAVQPRPRYQLKYLIGAFLIFGVIGYLIIFGLKETSKYALEVAELQARGAAAVGQGVRVIGNLDQNSIDKDVKGNKISFVIVDPKGSERLPITYSGVVPDTFDRATEVIAEGKLNSDGSFTASLVLAKCPSKYDESKLEWHSSTDPGNLNYAE